ncbi:MAG: methyl-accepting chemotaxis protein [Dethiosulfovibrio sp.]|nr:methyl-accepting chemotaxis protein [Dethiosulfovibrio sp.]
MTIRHRFGLLLVILVLTLVGMGGTTFLKGDKILKDQVSATGIETVRGSSEIVKEHFDMLAGIIDNNAMAIAQAWREGKRSFTDMQDIMVESLGRNEKRGFQDLYFGFESNGDFATSHRLVPPDGFDARKRSWYVLAKKLGKGKIGVTEPYIDVTTKQPVISLSTLIHDDQGNLIGAVGADVGIDHLVEFTKKLTILGQGKGLLLSGEGMVISGPIEAAVMVAKLNEKPEKDLSELGKRMISGETGTLDVDIRGAHTAFYTSTPWGISLAILYPNSAVASLIQSMTLPLLIISLIALVTTFITVFLTYRGISCPLRKISAIASSIKDRDLTVDPRSIGYRAKDELGHMILAIADMVDGFRSTIEHVAGESTHISTSSSGLAALSEQTSASMDEVKQAVQEMVALAETNAASLEETNAGVEEVSSSAHMAAESATQGTEATAVATNTAEGAVKLVSVVIDGVESVGKKSEETVKKMNSLAESVQKITGFIDTINSIADQTNLLALNAAIEAARAGEAGRGFAVVAEEVRKLAEESGHAAGKIDVLIGDLQRQAKDSIAITKENEETMKKTVDKASEARVGLERTLESIKTVNGAMQNIAATSQEQAASSNEMARAVDLASKSTVEMAEKVGSIRGSSQETAKASENVAKEAEKLAKLAQSIETELKKFRTKEAGLAVKN